MKQHVRHTMSKFYQLHPCEAAHPRVRLIAEWIGGYKAKIIAQAWAGKSGKIAGTFTCTANPNTVFPEWVVELKGQKDEVDRGMLLREIHLQINAYLEQVGIKQGVASVLLARCPDLRPRTGMPQYQPHELAMNAELAEQRAQETVTKSALIWGAHAVSRHDDLKITAFVAAERACAHAHAATHREAASAAATADAVAAGHAAAASAAQNAAIQAVLVEKMDNEKRIASAASAVRRADLAASKAAAVESARRDADAAAVLAHSAELLRNLETAKRRHASAVRSSAHAHAMMVAAAAKSEVVVLTQSEMVTDDSDDNTVSDEDVSMESILALCSCTREQARIVE